METFDFEGERLTHKDVAARTPAYHPRWILLALRAGCTTRADLTQREALNKAKSHRGAIKGRQEAERQGMAKLLVGRGT